MISSLRYIFLVFFITISVPLIGQSNTKTIVFPDIDGYQTLLCDFHMHTVYSDGLVWPTLRVSEAINEGLDAICITDHIEYRPNFAKLLGDHNTSYEIAKPYADKKDLILIRGAEITKAMPPGHFNMIFIQDANPIDVPEWQESLRIANEQGAFVFWNHPGWRIEDEIPIWYDEHSWLLERGWIQGIEIVNENSYYPLAHQWAIDSGLTIVGNSDIHDPIDMFFDRCKGEHRPVTLVFAKERTEEGIRQALDNKRTAIYFKDKLIGDEAYLRPLIFASIEVTYQETNGLIEKNTLLCKNNSSIVFDLNILDPNGDEIERIMLIPGEIVSIPRTSTYVLSNVLISPGQALEIELSELMQ